MLRFDTLEIAQAHVGESIDQPAAQITEQIRPGMRLDVKSIELADGNFTNIYDLRTESADLEPDVIAFKGLTSVHNFLSSQKHSKYSAVTGGGFFYLTDELHVQPRHMALNLSVSRSRLRSLPVQDQEAVLLLPTGLRADLLEARGRLTINDRQLDWSGSKTDHDTELKIFGNGNCVIEHHVDPATGSSRKLSQQSRYTPPITQAGFVDAGFIGKKDGSFKLNQANSLGGADIFASDFVLRTPERYLYGGSRLRVTTIGSYALHEIRGGFNAGPLLETIDFSSHPINSDQSLGSRPPFLDVRLARTALFKTTSGELHVRLYDGRPNSPRFSGVTPDEAAQDILSNNELEWGCFLDPGQTAKIAIKTEGGVASYGNRHYLRWPNSVRQGFKWVPDTGRPVANVIAL